jgi:hypothetical protein
MTTLREAAQQALEALESTQLFAAHEHYPRRRVADTLDALRAALEQPDRAQKMRATGWVAPKDHYTTPVFFNPYTGDPRDVRDVRSDPQGILIVPPGAAWLTAKG